MSTVIVIGSGPSGVHLAATLLDLGHAVTMLDVGTVRPSAVLPDADFNALKTRLDDPATYFLGVDGRGIAYPTARPRYFVHPPSKDYVFAMAQGFEPALENFEPAISFAAGGLAEAWTGGVYALNDAELVEFPFDAAALAPYYAQVARRIGISAARDDLERFCGWLDDYLEPVSPDPHARALLERYRRHRTALNETGFHLGRSRVAVLSSDRDDRGGCAQLGRCLWGCPRQSLYAPSITLRVLERHPSFRYIADAFVTHFNYEPGGHVTGVSVRAADGAARTFDAEIYALAAGTLCSSKIVLDSIFHGCGRVLELPGLMDNGQFLVPFLNLSRLGLPVDTHAYQFHQLALGVERRRAEEYVHGQITTLKAASVHPVAQNLPLDLRSALDVFRMTHAALGAANVWLHDRRDSRNVVTIRPRHGRDSQLVVRCALTDAERFREPMALVKKALRRLGCFVPPGMSALLPRGSSVHYAGTLPMNDGHEPGCTAECRSHDFRNLYFADGASFPFLPAKNLTFTLMANAARIGTAIDRDLRAGSTVEAARS